jgi:hypothetical protein
MMITLLLPLLVAAAAIPPLPRPPKPLPPRGRRPSVALLLPPGPLGPLPAPSATRRSQTRPPLPKLPSGCLLLLPRSPLLLPRSLPLPLDCHYSSAERLERSIVAYRTVNPAGRACMASHLQIALAALVVVNVEEMDGEEWGGEEIE